MQSEDIPPMNDPVSATRVLCGALLLPTIASLCGRLFFESINSNFQRTLLVCIVKITICKNKIFSNDIHNNSMLLKKLVLFLIVYLV